MSASDPHGSYPGVPADDVLGNLDEPAPTRRKRPIHPALVAVTAALAVAVASAVGVVAVGDPVDSASASNNQQTPVSALDQPDPAPPNQATSTSPSAPASPSAPPASPSPPASKPPAPKPTKPNAPAKPPPQATGDAALEAEVVTIVNAERAQANCGPLTAESRLTAAARKHSADMAGRDFFSHDSPDGVSFDKRITAEGYRFRSAGENIAKGQRNPEEVMRAWMDSPGHRANILNCAYTEIGVGVAFDGRTPIWTQEFATPL